MGGLKTLRTNAGLKVFFFWTGKDLVKRRGALTKRSQHRGKNKRGLSELKGKMKLMRTAKSRS